MLKSVICNRKEGVEYDGEEVSYLVIFSLESYLQELKNQAIIEILLDMICLLLFVYSDKIRWLHFYLICIETNYF